MGTYIIACENSSAADRAGANIVLKPSDNIMSHITSLANGSNNTVLIRGGNYNGAGSFNTSQSNIVLEGAGKDKVVITCTDRGQNLRFHLRGGMTTIRGITFRGYCSIWYYASDKLFENVNIIHSLDGVHPLDWGTSHGPCTAAFMGWLNENTDNIQHIDCKAELTVHHGYSMNRNNDTSKPTHTNWLFRRCQAISCGNGMEGNGRGDWATGFDIPEYAKINGMLVEDCYAYNCWQSGFHMDGMWDQDSHDIYHHVVYSNCKAENCGWRAYNGDGIGVARLTPHDNYDSGFYIAGSHATLINCITVNCARAGIYRKQMVKENGGSVTLFGKTFNCTGGIHNHRDNGSGMSLLIEDGSTSPLIENFVSYRARICALWGAWTNMEINNFKIIDFQHTVRDPIFVCANCDWRLTTANTEVNITNNYANYGNVQYHAGIDADADYQLRKYFLQNISGVSAKGSSTFAAINIYTNVASLDSVDKLFLRHQYGNSFTNPSSNCLHTGYSSTQWDLDFTHRFGVEPTPEPEPEPEPDPPKASIAYSPIIGAAPWTVRFRADLANATAVSYSWDLGNGTTSTEREPQVTYARPGWYKVSVVINQAYSASLEGFVKVTGAEYTILPLGDLLAAGPMRSGTAVLAPNIPGYRKALYDSLVAAGYNFEFGGYTTYPDYPTTGTAWFDQRHAAHAGANTRQLVQGVPNGPKVLECLGIVNPDIVLLTTGVVDIVTNDTANTLSNMLLLVKACQAINPNVVVLIATLPSVGTAGQQESAASLRSQMLTAVPKWVTATSRVALVDINSGFDQASMMSSDYFLTAAGAAHVASRFFAKLKTIILGETLFEITESRELSVAGEYTLMNDLTVQANCIGLSIIGKSIVLNGNGKTINLASTTNTAGVYVPDGVTQVTIKNVNFTGGGMNGIYLHGSSNVRIENCTFDCINCIQMVNSYNNEITGCTMLGTVPFLISDSSTSTIWNNKFMCSSAPLLIGTTANSWSNLPIDGLNIIGGPKIGGNFWGRPDGTGYSQTATDDNKDGICDNEYQIDQFNIDLHPLRQPGEITRSPYSAHTVPGIIKAVKYDIGGEGVTYHDTTLGNVNHLFRNDGVDIAYSPKVQNYIVINGEDGEWLDYTTNLWAGIYGMELMACATSPGAMVTLYRAGVLAAVFELPTVSDNMDVRSVSPTIGPSSMTVENGESSILKLYIQGSGVSIYQLRFYAIAPIGRTLKVFPGCINLPNDLDGDGIYEDMNGNGRADFDDIVKHFDNLDWIAANQPIEAFDVNRNGRIDFADTVAFYNMLGEGSEENPPTVLFDADILEGLSPLTVTFKNKSTHATSFAWFVDGVQVATSRDLVWTFTGSGRFTVKLAGTNVAGTTELEKENYIYVRPNERIVADFDAVIFDGMDPFTIQFRNKSVNHSTKYPTMTYAWNFFETPEVIYPDISPIHTFPGRGSYKVSLTVTNGEDTDMRILFFDVGYSEPYIDFTAKVNNKDNLGGLAPLMVRFISLCSNDITEYRWDFGDGGVSNVKDPVYVYRKPGVYNVKLTGTNPNGTKFLIKENYVYVLPSVVTASFYADSTTGPAPCQIKFINTSIGANKFSWDFGDGGISSEEHPIYTYTKVGVYTVILRAINDRMSASETKVGYITVSSGIDGLVASFTAVPRSGLKPLVVEFTSTVTLDGKLLHFSPQSIVDGRNEIPMPPVSQKIFRFSTPTSYSWDFGDGTPSKSGLFVRHTYTTPGTYTPKLYVETETGMTIVSFGNYVYIGEGTPPELNGHYDQYDPTIIANAYINPMVSTTAPATVSFRDYSKVSSKMLSRKIVFIGLEREWVEECLTHVPGDLIEISSVMEGIEGVNYEVRTELMWDRMVTCPWPKEPNTTLIFRTTSAWTTTVGGFCSDNAKTVVEVSDSDFAADDYKGRGFVIWHENLHSIPGIESADAMHTSTGFRTWLAVRDPGNDFLTTYETHPDTLDILEFYYQYLTEQWKLLVESAPPGTELLYEWDFGDNTPNSTEANPIHTYTENGTYKPEMRVSYGTINFTVYDIDGIRVTDVENAADFKADVVSGLVPLNVLFTDLSALNPTRWYWDFGDGEVSTEQNPRHTYLSPGVYIVKLVVWGDGWTDSAEKSGYISVSSQANALQWKCLLIDDLPTTIMYNALPWIPPQVWNFTSIYNAAPEEWWDWVQDNGGHLPWPHTVNTLVIHNPAFHQPLYAPGAYASSRVSVQWTKFMSPWQQAVIMLHELLHEMSWQGQAGYTPGAPNVDEMIRCPSFDVWLSMHYPEFYNQYWWPEKLATGWRWDITQVEMDAAFAAGTEDTLYDKSINRYNHGYGVIQHIFYKYVMDLYLGYHQQPVLPELMYSLSDIQNPYGEIAIESYAGSSPIEVTFVEQVTNIGWQGTTTYTWNFGDGNMVVGSNPTHAYARPGRYTVQMTARHVEGVNQWSRSFSLNIYIDIFTWVITFR